MTDDIVIRQRMSTVAVSWKMALSASSPTAMFLALLSIVELESNGRGYTVSTLFDTEMVPGIQNGHCLGYSMAMLFADGVLYVVATWILDQWLRSEHGQSLSLKQIAAQMDCCALWRFRARSALTARRRPPGGGSVRYKALPEQSGNDEDKLDDMVDDVDPDEVGQRGNGAECSKTVSIEIRDLSKVFRARGIDGQEVRALDGLTMDIFEGECCALLGPNGAGKSTTMNVLSGMTEATSGSARISGYSVRREMHRIRRSLGVCPQHSLLWPMLTVHEHLALFAALKELTPSEMEQDIDRLLHDVTLTEKKGAFSSTLSGGQRRKLGVAIALIGDPQIIFLDEPTSGMDPLSRRHILDLLKRRKEGRCIVLTTHDLNEADAISDRIAILCRGALQIYGTALHLKSVCGVGYNLVFTVDCSHCDAATLRQRVEALSRTVSSFVDDATLFDAQNVWESVDRIAGGTAAALSPSGFTLASLEVVFKTKMSDSRRFPLLMEHIDARRSTLHIASYAVSVTTMEEVFLSIAGGDGLAAAHSRRRRRDRVPFRVDDDDDDGVDIDCHLVDRLLSMKRPDLSSFEMARIHISSVIRKRWTVARRDLRGVLTQCVLPALSLLFGLSLLGSQSTSTEWMDIDGDVVDDGVTAVSASPPVVVLALDLDAAAIAIECPLPLILPMAVIAVDGVDVDAVDDDDDGHSVSLMTASLIHSLLTPHSEHVAVRALHSVLWQSLRGQSGINGMNEWMVNESWSGGPPRSDSLYGALYVDVDADAVTLLFSGTATHLLAAMVNEWDRGVLRSVSGNGSASISVHSAPFVHLGLSLSAHSGSADIGAQFGMSLMTVIVVSMSYAFIPSSFAPQIVRERASTVKRQQFVGGMSVSSYWIGNLLFDVVLFMAPCLLSGGVMMLFGGGPFGVYALLVPLFVLFLAFGLSVLSLTYLLSFFFVSPHSAQTILGRVYEMSGLILLILGIMMTKLLPDGLWWLDAVLSLFRCFPNYSFGEGLFNVLSMPRETVPAMRRNGDDGPFQSVWEWPVLGRDLSFLAAQTVLFLTAIGIAECMASSVRLQRCWLTQSRCRCPRNWRMRWTQCRSRCRSRWRRCDVAAAGTAEGASSGDLSASMSLRIGDPAECSERMDSDVVAERERIESGSSSSSSAMETVALRKVYGDGEVAVDGLWCAVGHSEVLGLIGPNGAGKSSTLKMLVKEVVPSAGTCFFGSDRRDLLGSDYRSFLVGSHLGYCPQSDGLIQLFTGREHLDFYCRIRGFSKRDSRIAVDTLIGALNLTPFSDVVVGTYSAGNRRKICVGIALIGNPELMLLDEPSTGIDPISRRKMWNFIAKITAHSRRSETAKRSVLLTTHSMEEAEALCHRIAIMDRGNLQCIGSAQHLKTKYGDVDGYRLFIKLEDGAATQKKDNLKRRVLQNAAEQLAVNGKAPRIRLLDDDNATLTFSIRRGADHDHHGAAAEHLPLGKLFGFIESIKSEFQILEYSIGQNTLEQVFMQLVRRRNKEMANKLSLIHI